MNSKKIEKAFDFTMTYFFLENTILNCKRAQRVSYNSSSIYSKVNANGTLDDHCFLFFFFFYIS